MSSLARRKQEVKGDDIREFSESRRQLESAYRLQFALQVAQDGRARMPVAESIT